MKNLNIFTLVILFFLVIGVVVSFTKIVTTMLIPIVIVGLILYFLANPQKLKFFKRGRGNKHNTYTNQRYYKSNTQARKRRNTFTVVDGKYKEVKNDKDDN